MTPIFYGRTRNGRLLVDQREKFEAYLRGMSGAEIEIAVRRRRRARTLSQNDFYRAIVHLIAEYAGGEEEEVHEGLKLKFIKGRSTTELTTVEMSEYIDRCIQEAAEMGISLPDRGQ